MPKVIIVIPCYNEAKRLNSDAFYRWVQETPVNLLFVDDGSSDGTHEVLGALVARAPDRLKLLLAEENSGKGEAIRRGFLRAMADGAQVVGFVDADLATTPKQAMSVLHALEKKGVSVAIGARVAMMGHRIERKALRHYLGRIFATAASLVLDASIYDTQCGAKFFRVSEAFQSAIKEPFLSRWIFDVELLGRLLIGGPTTLGLSEDEFVEVPLAAWKDMPGSKLRPGDLVEIGIDLVRLRNDLEKRRKRV